MQACDYCRDPAVWRVMGALGVKTTIDYKPPLILCEWCLAMLAEDVAEVKQHLQYEPLILDKPGGES